MCYDLITRLFPAWQGILRRVGLRQLPARRRKSRRVRRLRSRLWPVLIKKQLPLEVALDERPSARHVEPLVEHLVLRWHAPAPLFC